MSVVIKAENISKQYKLGTVGISSLTDDVQRLIAKIKGKEDPFLKVGQVNARSEALAEGSSKFVWALKDINFEINQGEVVGIIGKNGAGKSTLLKILSRVTEPTIGKLKYKGRLASLLEVGTGFHPDLSGRDNVFLNGAILGMKKHEIAEKFDEIVEFSGVAKYIDTPVKRYSSGMYVRLAFAVAAHLEPDILVIDEVLAVGDQEFQDKCLGKMKDVAGQGRTVLFVSHNIHAIKAICKTGIFLEHGKISESGTIDKTINKYLRANLSERAFLNDFNDKKPQDINYCVNKVYIKNHHDVLTNQIEISKSFTFYIDFTVKQSCYAKFSFIIKNSEGLELFASLNNHEPNYYKQKLNPGNYISSVQVNGDFLNKGSFFISVICSSEYNWAQSFVIEDALLVEAIDDGVLKSDYYGDYGGYLRPRLNWETTKV